MNYDSISKFAILFALATDLTYDDALRIMDLNVGFSADDLTKAYKKKVVKMHPDVNKSENAHQDFVLMQMAYETLKNPRLVFEETFVPPDVNAPVDFEKTPYGSYQKTDSDDEVKLDMLAPFLDFNIITEKEFNQIMAKNFDINQFYDELSSLGNDLKERVRNISGTDDDTVSYFEYQLNQMNAHKEKINGIIEVEKATFPFKALSRTGAAGQGGLSVVNNHLLYIYFRSGTPEQVNEFSKECKQRIRDFLVDTSKVARVAQRERRKIAMQTKLSKKR